MGVAAALPAELTGVTELPWVIVTVFASDTSQLNIEELPVVMLPGLAVKKLITGGLTEGGGSGGGSGGAPETVTRALAVTVPAALVAVRV